MSCLTVEVAQDRRLAARTIGRSEMQMQTLRNREDGGRIVDAAVAAYLQSDEMLFDRLSHVLQACTVFRWPLSRGRGRRGL